MLITDEEILNYVRKNYTAYSNYNFNDNAISEEKDFIIVKDIHEINEDVLNISKDIFIRGLQISRQTNCINISNLCDSLNAESCDLAEDVYKELEKYNKTYTKAFLRNGSRWVDLYAFNLTCDKAKEVIGNKNPRVLFNISKYSHILNATLLNTTNLRLSVIKLQSLLELMHTEIRKMNYDMIFRPVTTVTKGNENETLVQTKYMNNFFLHEDIKFDHEFQVFGTIAGLAARKKRGEFGRVKPYYYQFKLYALLKKEYGYLNFNIEILDGIDEPIFVNQRQVAHKVLLRRKKVISSFSSFSKFTAKILLNYKLPKEAFIYDYNHPIELSSLLVPELNELIKSKEGMLVYHIDETLYDSFSMYDTLNPQSSVVVEKGEFFDAYYNLFGVTYNRKIQVNSVLDYVNHFLIFSKTLKSHQIQRVKLFDSMMYQQKNAIIRAEQAEKAVHELQKSNELIKELNASLLDKVAERTKELELANEQKTNTFVNLAHETKTPLTLINNYLEVYINQQGKTKELEIIKFNIEKLTKNIVNFFDLERISKGFCVYNHDQISDFTTIVQNSVELFKYYNIKKNIEIIQSIEKNILVKADPESLCRIVNNLLENAIKYTNENGRIEVALKYTHEKIHFSIKDNGIGIPPELHATVFDPYYQVNSEKNNFQGMGLGLSIVKKIIESINGELVLKSDTKEETGTEITVQLSRYKILRDEIIAELKNNNMTYLDAERLDVKDEIHDEENYTVMVVEDNVSMLNYMVPMLKEKYNVYIATSGTEALKKLSTITRLDLIVSDVMMDKGDGLELYTAISNRKKFNHIPFIFVTAKTNIHDKIQGLSLGAIDYIFKPFLINELTTKIDAVLNNLSNQRKAIIDNAYKTLLQEKEPKPSNTGTQNKFEENCTKFKLTLREKEIVQLIAKGQIYKEIADNLSISMDTVKKHNKNIFEKVAVNNKVELLNKLGIPSLG